MADDGSDPEESAANDPAAPALAAWAREPRLAALVADPAATYWVLEAESLRLIRASDAGRAWAGAVFGADGAPSPRLALPEQIRRAAPSGEDVRLVRLRLDPRRIAPPVACLLARGRLGTGEPALLVVPTQAAPPMRRDAAETLPPAVDAQAPADAPPPVDAAPSADDAPCADEAAPVPALPSAEPAPPPRPGDRFVWRSDAADRITEVTGAPRAALAPLLVGRSWQALAEAGHLAAADPLLAALAERQTFRAVPAELRPAPAAEGIGIDLSGAPLARNGHPFAGYGGFGLVRAAIPVDDASAEQPEAAPHEGAAESSREAASGAAPEMAPPTPEAEASAPSLGPAVAALATLSLAALVPAARFGRMWTGRDRTLPVDRSARPGSPAQADPPEPPSAEAAAEPAEERELSISEHAAFREIARALGARFAGDDAPAESERPQEGGAVMPFPAARLAENRQAEADLAEARALLDALPVPILVRRDDSLLHANAAFLDLAGFADGPAFQGAGGLARLILRPEAGPEPNSSADRLITREDGVRPVEIARAVLTWQGAPAEALVLRPAKSVPPAEFVPPAEPVPPAAAPVPIVAAVPALPDLDAFDDGVLTLDAEDRVVALNRAAAEMLGRDASRAVGLPLLGLFAAESAMQLRAALHAAGAPAREVAVPGRGPVSVRLARPLSDGRRLAILRDLGERKRLTDAVERARAEAEQAEAWRANFLAKVSHEIRTPMNGILGFADVMLSEPFGPLPERYRDYLRDIHASGEHVLGLVNDLVDLARIESGNLDLAFGPLPLNDLVSSCVALLQPQAARDRIVVRTSFSADLTTLVADERSMRQAALNVIANAIRFTEAGGQVIVSTTVAERGEIALRVRDTGVGMSPDEIESALEPFRAGAVSGPRKGGGTGLGLPLTKALVEANHGRFRITSRKDEGTLVEMLFPARTAMSA
ncbi:ATP-binding protein [Methylobacterium oxalidis]|uniref:ATP-binding protein n=1 Tax=Methylobacterium oxalidis TaxID=944322 RepID=UPI0033148CA7